MPQATMFAEWCDPCRRLKGSWLLRTRLELRFMSLAQHIALAPRSARWERGVAHTNKTICAISSAGHVFKRVLRRSQRNPRKGSSEVPPSDPYMAHGSIKRWEGKQKCFFFPLREYNPSIPLYLYTWAQPVSLVSLVGVRCGWGMLGSNLSHTIMSSPETKKTKTNDTTQPKYLITISTNSQKPLGSLNLFKLARLLDSAAGSKLANVTRLSSGYFLLETSSSKQSAQLQKMELLGDIPVHIYPQKSMNFTKGVTKTSDLKDMSQQEIIANMHS